MKITLIKSSIAMQGALLPVTQPFPPINVNPNAILPAAQGENRTFQAIFNTVSREVPQIPQAIHGAIGWFRRAHSYYRWYKLYTLQRDAQNNGGGAEAVVYGPAITFLADVSQSVNFALNFAVVTKCTLDVLGKYRELNSSLNEWRDAICLKTIFRRNYPLDAQVHRFSRSIFLSWDLELGTLFQQIIRVIRCTLVVLWKAFELSMILEDTRLYFARDDQTRFVACTDLVVNWRSYAGRFGNELGRVSESLGLAVQENEPIAQKLLTELGENNTPTLVNNVIGSLRGAGNVIRTVLPQSDPLGPSLLPFDRMGNLQTSRFRIPQIPRGRLHYSSPPLTA